MEMARVLRSYIKFQEIPMGIARVLAAAVAIAGNSNSAAVAASCGGSMNKGRIKPDKTG